jgi:radical SAM superfamily enzyme YgiQ (UPF0313 family)
VDFVGRIWRPPSEAESLLLQVSVGCSHNRCTFCGMYRLPEQRFRPKPWARVVEDIEHAARLAAAGLEIRRAFLCDGDALILPTDRLERILSLLREKVPSVRRVGIYGDCRSVLRKSIGELRRLRELGLQIVYHGVESGDPVVLDRIRKDATPAAVLATGERLREADIRHSVIFMLGIGGRHRSRQHAEATADLLTSLDPPYAAALTTTLVPGTPLYAEVERGDFILPDRWQLLAELETIIERSRFTRCRFHANHASNYLPLSLNLPVDRESALALLREVRQERRDLRLRAEYRRGL